MQRAIFTVTFSGTPAETERTTEWLAERLTENGYFFDEDWCFATRGSLEGRSPRVGVELRTAGAVRTALDALPHVGACLVETNPELVEG